MPPNPSFQTTRVCLNAGRTSFVGPCIFSALASSALTLIAVQWHRSRTVSDCGSQPVLLSEKETFVSDNHEGEHSEPSSERHPTNPCQSFHHSIDSKHVEEQVNFDIDLDDAIAQLKNKKGKESVGCLGQRTIDLQQDPVNHFSPEKSEHPFYLRRSSGPAELSRGVSGSNAPKSKKIFPKRRASLSGSFSSVDGVDITDAHSVARASRHAPRFSWDSGHDGVGNRWRMTRRPSSSSGSFSSFDGNYHEGRQNAVWPRHITPQHHQECLNDEIFGSKPEVEVSSEENWFADDKAVMQAKEFDERVLSKLTNLEESKMLLRRTRAVAALSSRLMAAPDEQACFEEVSRLLVPLFQVDRTSYCLMAGSDHIIIKQVTATKRKHAVNMGREGLGAGVIKPIKDTALGICAQTLEQHYTPRTRDSQFVTQRKAHAIGLNCILCTPILVDGNKFAGGIVISMMKEDAFKEHDRMLVSDIAAMLGANIFAKRMRQASEFSNKISREMLHSMIPARVIEKIECFWDETSDEYQNRHSNNTYDSADSFSHALDDSFTEAFRNGKDHRCVSSHPQSNREVNEKIHFLQEMNRLDADRDDIGVVVDTSALELNSTSRALYAENVNDVCIIFTDIVGFSQISLKMEPIQTLDMLQNLFSRFDDLCDKHNVEKLETIGDAYICTTGLFDNDDNRTLTSIKCAALNALKMAKDMVCEAQKVFIPARKCNGEKCRSFNTVEIRVGIHVGNVTCGVLGQRLPKLTVFGNAVNMAARMEQTSIPNKIRVTEDFHRLVADEQEVWDGFNVLSIKNMGDIGTYLLDPLKRWDTI